MTKNSSCPAARLRKTLCYLDVTFEAFCVRALAGTESVKLVSNKGRRLSAEIGNSHGERCLCVGMSVLIWVIMTKAAAGD